MGNWTVSAGGVISQQKTLDLLTLTGGNSILGRAVILHQNFDDCTGTVGNAGGRLAQCVIGLATPASTADTNNAAPSPGITTAICNIRPTAGNNVTGTVMLIQTDPTGPTRVVAHLTGLDGNPHGFHIHEFGDVSSPTATAAGGHYNPLNVHHAIPPFPVRHIGDMGNIVYYDQSGDAWYDYTNDMIDLDGEYSVIGRAIIVHQMVDNCASPVGNAGSRWGQCVIGVMNSTKPVITPPTGTTDTQDDTPCNALYTLPATTTDSNASARSIILALVAALVVLCSFFSHP
jgi:Cu-Zn family superoxide dismutase